MIALLAKIYALLQRAHAKDLHRKYRKRYDIAPSFRFNGLGIQFHGEGEIHAGEGSYIGRYSQVQAAEGFKVTIGNRVSMSHFVKIYTRSRNPENREQLIGGDVTIRDGVWIGAGVFIRQGVVIGENSVIGANAVVTRDVPPNVVAGGVPCRVIRQMSPPYPTPDAAETA